MTDNNDPNMCLTYEDEEAAADDTELTDYQLAWTKTFSMKAGDYIIIASAIVYNNLGYTGSIYRIQMDNSVDILPEQSIANITASVVPIFIVKKVNIAADGDHVFDFDFKAGGGGEQASIKEKRIVCMRVCL